MATQTLNYQTEVKANFKADVINYVSKVDDETYQSDCNKLVKATAMHIKSVANISYKNKASLNVDEITQIKNSLVNYTNDDKRVNKFKDDLINNLTELQNTIKTNHQEKIIQSKREKGLCTSKAIITEIQKNKLIMDRLSKVQWPYDEKTKAYDKEIVLLKLRAEKASQKLEQLKKTIPAADEKTLLLYQIQLKEKYSA